VPANPRNRLVQVAATHFGTPADGTAPVLDWLKTLLAR
jgi:hypothetical protein